MRHLILLGSAAVVLAFAVPSAAREKETKKVVKRDKEVAVSTTRTTAAVYDDRDVAESRAGFRREVEHEHWTLAPSLGWGTDGLGVGVGARLGYTFDTPVYIGGNMMYHAGEGTPRLTAYYPSAEIGYDIGVGPMMLRPYGGVGVLFRGGDVPTTSAGLLYPGFTVHWLIPRSPAFLGGDARVLLPFEGSGALALTGTAGLNF